jgi:DNA-directed RNA polymerase subunit RPC12/RpoP
MPQERHDSGSDAGPAQASDVEAQRRENPAGEAEPGAGRTEAVLTLICETCGKDYFFEDEPPPENIKCEKCGATVFRSFHSSVGDEAADDFRDSTERDLHPDDAEGDTLPGDVMDLNRI